MPVDQLPHYPESHIIGELRYVLEEGKRVSALALYEASLPTNSNPPDEPEIRAEIIGDARGIKCTQSDCYRAKRWVLGRQSFMQLQQRYKAML